MSERFMSYEQASKAAVKLKIKSAEEYKERYEQEKKDEPSHHTNASKKRK
ncbi:hypothetical protein [Vibrio sp. 10N.222.52.B12]|jgi:hypothetical protein|nr:hypothetical protein [Vibrio sp. 10N.222.52.B12]